MIAALDRADAHHPVAQRVLIELAGSGTPFLISLVNYAETLVRPAEDGATLELIAGSIEQMGVALIAPTPAVARYAARMRAHGVSLADGFAIATARAYKARLATFDKRVRRASDVAGVELAPGLQDPSR